MANKYTYYQFLKDYPDDDACLDTLQTLRYGSNPDPAMSASVKPSITALLAAVSMPASSAARRLHHALEPSLRKSSTSLHKWFFAMYLFTTSRHGVSGKELEAKLGVTYKCAWRMGHQIRKLMDELNISDLFGDVEADETYVGGRRSGTRDAVPKADNRIRHERTGRRNHDEGSP